MKRALLYFDLETVPNDSLSDLWELRKEELIKRNPNEQYYAATSPEFCKIVALGWANDDAPPKSLVVGLDSKNRNGELVMVTEELVLRVFWNLVNPSKNKPEKENPVLVGFNILGFDLPTIFIRSAILSIEPTRFINRTPWKNECIDLFQTRRYTNGGGGLKDLAKYFSFDIPTEDMEGSQVQRLYAEDPSQIGAYVESDVVVTRQLYHFYKGFFVEDYTKELEVARP
jgi:hypothetical protein